jgi:hypothetical protein
LKTIRDYNSALLKTGVAKFRGGVIKVPFQAAVFVCNGNDGYYCPFRRATSYPHAHHWRLNFGPM